MNRSKKYIAKIVSLTLLCVWFCGCNRMDTMEEEKEGFRFFDKSTIIFRSNYESKSTVKWH